MLGVISCFNNWLIVIESSKFLNFGCKIGDKLILNFLSAPFKSSFLMFIDFLKEFISNLLSFWYWLCVLLKLSFSWIEFIENKLSFIVV